MTLSFSAKMFTCTSSSPRRSHGKCCSGLALCQWQLSTWLQTKMCVYILEGGGTIINVLATLFDYTVQVGLGGQDQERVLISGPTTLVNDCNGGRIID